VALPVVFDLDGSPKPRQVAVLTVEHMAGRRIDRIRLFTFHLRELAKMPSATPGQDEERGP